MVDDQALNVVCVLWQGDFRHRNYSSEWVSKLRKAAAPHLPPHKFVCLSNVEVDDPLVHRIPLVSDLAGWWAKLELFRRDLPLTGKILYFDLDVLPIRSLGSLVTKDTTFMPSSYRFTGGKPALRADYSNRYQSSAFCFEAGSLPELCEDFNEEAMNTFRGDQDWIGWRRPDFKTYPPHWFQKLRNCPDGPPPDVKLVLSMPWKNDVAAKKFEWVREIWE